MNPTRMLEAEFVVARRSFDVVAGLHLAEGERLSLFGPSGSGKTTCLEAVAGSVTLLSGQIRLDGRVVNAARKRWRHDPARRPVEPRDRGVAFVRQPTTLFPHLNVRANITYRARKRPLFGDRTLEQLLEEVGLEGLAEVKPDSLSGGQRQRACLARAIARPFRALLLDEPFAAVDVASRVKLRTIATDATVRAGAVALLVTHDLAEAQAFGHRLAILDEGRVLQIGSTAELVRKPETMRVAELCGFTSFVPQDSGNYWALHPDRFVEGAWPDRGIVLAGTVRSVQPFGPRFACEMVPVAGSPSNGNAAVGPSLPAGARMLPDQGVVRVHVETPPHVGERWEVTALRPPLVKPSRACSSSHEVARR